MKPRFSPVCVIQGAEREHLAHLHSNSPEELSPLLQKIFFSGDFFHFSSPHPQLPEKLQQAVLVLS